MYRLTLSRACAVLASLWFPAVGLAGDHQGEHGVSWSSIDAVLPGPKPEPWVLSAEALAAWKSQSAAQVGSDVGVGDERAWKLRGQPVRIVVLRLPLATGCEAGPWGFIVGILDANGQLLARSSELFSEGSYGNVSKRPYRIDVAPYRVSDAETAFGIRIVHADVQSRRCYADEVLNLFRVIGKDVVRILSTDAFYQQREEPKPGTDAPDKIAAQVPDDVRCAFRYTGSFPPKGKSAVFRMLSRQTQGFYDIERSLGPVAVTYRWNGQCYVMDGKDPASHQMRDASDWCKGRLYLADHGFLPAAPSSIAERAAKLQRPCARAAFHCVRCQQGEDSPFEVGETFVDSKRAVAAANERLRQEDAAGIARELRVGSVGVSLLEMAAQGMGGLAVLRQDPGRVCVTGTWAWDFGGNEVGIDIAAVEQAPARNGVLVALKAVGRSPHGAEESSYYPDVRLLLAFLITAEKVDRVLSEFLDDEPNPSYGEWPEPVRVERSGSSLRLRCGQRAWILAPDRPAFVPAGRAREQR
jgi:hypothetical protein